MFLDFFFKIHMQHRFFDQRSHRYTYMDLKVKRKKKKTLTCFPTNNSNECLLVPLMHLMCGFMSSVLISGMLRLMLSYTEFNYNLLFLV